MDYVNGLVNLYTQDTEEEKQLQCPCWEPVELSLPKRACLTLSGTLAT
jgi:hypothetical protein